MSTPSLSLEQMVRAMYEEAKSSFFAHRAVKSVVDFWKSIASPLPPSKQSIAPSSFPFQVVEKATVPERFRDDQIIYRETTPSTSANKVNEMQCVVNTIVHRRASEEIESTPSNLFRTVYVSRDPRSHE